MRLHAYVLTAALCAATAGAAFAQMPGAAGVTMQVAAGAQPAAGRQIAAQPARAEALTASATTASSAPVAQASAATELSTQDRSPNSNLQAIVRQHAVITTDDLREMRFNTAEVFIPTEFTDQPAVDPALCDAGCEAETRSAAGMDHVRDAEWQAQFQAAQMDLASDRAWGHAYADGMQRLHSYCVFQDQARKAFPRGGNQASQAQRAQWTQYVGQMDRALGGAVDSSAARIQQDIQQAQRRDSVRAAIMEVLAEKAFGQCTVAR
jgi:hypothetical protein